MNPPKIRTVFAGLGPIGLATLEMMERRSWVDVVGAVDIDPELAGRDVGQLAGIQKSGVRVVPNLADVGAPGCADVVVLCTSSRIQTVEQEVAGILDWGASVVTTCEELSYPWFHHPAEAKRIDKIARDTGMTVLGTGVNPGFAMDAVALYVSGACDRVDSVEVRRTVDAGTRRGPLQRKIGAGITTAEFEKRHTAGKIGHMGLVESAAMLAAAFGWTPDAVNETLEPVVSDRPITTDHANVVEGSVAGIRQIAVAVVDGEERVRLHLDMFVGAEDPGDRIIMNGRPNLSTTIIGLHGDISTAAMTTNGAAALRQLPPGLMTMVDAAPVRWYPLS